MKEAAQGERTERAPSEPSAFRLPWWLDRLRPTTPADVFVSYRRADDQAKNQVRLIALELEAHYGKGAVFFDDRTIEEGEPYPDTIRRLGPPVSSNAGDHRAAMGRPPPRPRRLGVPGAHHRRRSG